jgi:hypothetical protein
MFIKRMDTMKARYQISLLGICHHRENVEFGYQVFHQGSNHPPEIVTSLNIKFLQEDGSFMVIRK